MAGKSQPLAPRFWAKVDKNGPLHSELGRCWQWLRPAGEGYGQISVNGVVRYSHHVSWEIHCGEIPNGLWVLHRCDNRACVRPNHLFLGTRQDNVDDCVEKNRHNQGERHGMAKLTDELVRVLRRRYRFGSRKHGIGALAEEFGVGRVTVHRAVIGKSWKHVEQS